MHDQEIGEMRAELRHLRESVATIQADVAAMKDLLAQARGAQRTLMWLGGIVAVIASGVAWAMGYLRGHSA